MTRNVGTTDRVIRALLGVVLLFLALFSGLPFFALPVVKVVAIAVGVVMLAVAVVRVCPIYSIFGFRTCEV